MKYLITAVAILIASCSIQTTEKEYAVAAVQHSVQSLPFFWAVSEKLFTKNGIQLQPMLCESDSEVMDKIVNGVADFAFVPASLVAKLYNADKRIKIIGVLSFSDTDECFIHSNNSHRAYPESLEKMMIGLFAQNSSSGNYLAKVAEKYDQNDLPKEIFFHDLQSMVDAMDKGRIDGAFVSDTIARKIVSLKKNQFTIVQEQYLYYKNILIVVNAKKYENDEMLYGTILKVLLRAEKEINSNPKKVYTYVNKEFYDTNVSSDEIFGLYDYYVHMPCDLNLILGYDEERSKKDPSADIISSAVLFKIAPHRIFYNVRGTL